MRNKGNIFNFLSSGLVLFSILFQSIHSYEHLLEQMSEKICFHEHNENQSDLTHAHSSFEKCLVCHYSFSPFEFTNFSSALLKNSEEIANTNFIFYQKVSLFYKGSLFALRAPPTV